MNERRLAVAEFTLWFTGDGKPRLERTRFVSDDLHDKSGRRLNGYHEATPSDFQWRAGPQSLALFMVRALLDWQLLAPEERGRPCRFTGRFADTLYEALRKPDRLTDVAWPAGLFGYDSGGQSHIIRLLEVGKPGKQPTVQMNAQRLAPGRIRGFRGGQEISTDPGQLALLARALAESYFPDDPAAIPTPPGAPPRGEFGTTVVTRVFVSHSSRDRQFVEREIVGLLQGHGIGTWYAHTDIQAREEWERAILNGLEDCDWFLVVMSPRSAESEWVRDEVHWAMHHRPGRVVPILLEDCDLLAFHIRMPRLEYINFRSDRDAARRKLLAVWATRPGQPEHASGSVDPPADFVNPFVWRGGIRDAAAFFGREREQQRLRILLPARQNIQIVGERRIGKTSLLRQIERMAMTWVPGAVVAFVDLQSAGCATLAGWLRRVGEKFGWAAGDMVEFDEQVVQMLAKGRPPVLCLDEFEEFMVRPKEFRREFFLALRACGQVGLSIITASRRRLVDLADPNDTQVSAFYNTFSLITLESFSDAEAMAFVSEARPGVPPITGPEREAVIAFANGHPLALQVGCCHVLVVSP